jgi:hypothetical protein
MKKAKIPALSLLLAILISCSSGKVEFSTDYLSLEINKVGTVVQISDRNDGTNYLSADTTAPFLSIRINNVVYYPSSMEFRRDAMEMDLMFDPADVIATVKVREGKTHLTFEVIKVEPLKEVEMVIWGPYPTSINKSIGETVGVVRGEDFALGLQALNPKTLGGYPWTDNDCMPQIDIFEGNNYSDLSEEGKRHVLYRVEAAKPEVFGSTLQAYCRNRFEHRLIENWGHSQYLARAFDDGGVIGSAIALFGCPVENTLEIIGEIEVTEGLPHPTINGKWAKQSHEASSAYMILGFGEADIDKALMYTKKAGLKYLYHPGPFETWGHFPLNKQFPNGWEGLNSCVEKADEQGVYLGVHTLSNFITPNDAFVTPNPDDRLAKVGSTMLLRSIDSWDTEILINNPSLFSPAKNISMKTVQIGSELIQYREVSKQSPWKLEGCKRGAFGTKNQSHEEGSDVFLLADHAYKVFLSDADLTKEIGGNLAKLFNETGIRQISFDGLEGNRSTGMGNYGEILMTNTWYENLDESIKQHYIADASRTSHFFWHIYTRMNWGEPWYAGFRESQAEYRFKNQDYFQRNLMPGMLGWFLLTDQTSPEDIEWMLSKSAGYNAGFGFVCSYKSLQSNKKSNQLLNLIKRWETTRMQQQFPDSIREQLKSAEMEFHLEEDPDGTLVLWSLQVGRLEYSLKERQPGEPSESRLDFENIFDPQSLQFAVTTPDDGSIRDLKIFIDQVPVFAYAGPLNAGEILWYDGGNTVYRYAAAWQQTDAIAVKPSQMEIPTGIHEVGVDAVPERRSDNPVKIEIKTTGNPQKIGPS